MAHATTDIFLLIKKKLLLQYTSHKCIELLIYFI